MPKPAKAVLSALFCLSLAFAMSACKEGPAENAGEKIDQGVENTKDAAKDMKEDVQKKY